MKYAKQQGFTLIELIVVMVILGILAATALPRFADLGKDARIAVLRGIQGSLSSVSAMAHGKYLVSSTPPTTVSLEGASITFVNGYPAATTGGLDVAANILSQDFLIIPPNGAAGTGNIATGATQIVFVPSSVSTVVAGKTCYAQYTEATSLTTAPTISIVTTGC